jgi:hypothetical protein
MADRTLGQNAAEILRMVADIEKDLGELTMALLAQHLALCELVPNFESNYQAQMGSARVLHVKNEYERKILVFLEKADQVSKS